MIPTWLVSLRVRTVEFGVQVTTIIPVEFLHSLRVEPEVVFIFASRIVLEVVPSKVEINS